MEIHSDERVDWADYKRLCDQPNVMSRNLIEVTAALARDSDKAALSQLLLGACEGDGAAWLERPPDHHGDERTHMLKVGYSREQVDEVLALLDSAECQAGQVRRLVAFRAAWLEYWDWLKAQKH